MSAKIYCIVTKERLYHLEEARVEIRGMEIDSLWLDEAKDLDSHACDALAYAMASRIAEKISDDEELILFNKDLEFNDDL